MDAGKTESCFCSINAASLEKQHIINFQGINKSNKHSWAKENQLLDLVEYPYKDIHGGINCASKQNKNRTMSVAMDKCVYNESGIQPQNPH